MSQQLRKPSQFASDAVVETVKITPAIAAEWLKSNTLNRPLRRQHVAFLAGEMKSGNWLLNGESIKISEDENVIDGQHRLHACIDSGVTFKTTVVYGLKEEAFLTIDQGKPRTGSDALKLHFPDAPAGICAAVATACKWCHVIDSGWTSQRAQSRLSNKDILDYAVSHPELWQCANIINQYPSSQRLISLGVGTALYYFFNKRDSALAADYMEQLSTGENLSATDVAYHVRGLLIREHQKRENTPTKYRAMMIVNGWNVLREGKKLRGPRQLIVKPEEDPPKIK